MLRRAQIGSWLTVAASLVGVALACYLAWVHAHVHTQSGSGALCNLGPGWSCEAVASSRFAQPFGIPLAVLGGGFFLGALAVLGVGRRTPDGDDDLAAPSALLVTLYGTASLVSVGLFLMSVMAIGSLCPGCVAVYLTSFAGLAGAWLWHGQGPLRLAQRQLAELPYVLGSRTALAFAVTLVSTVAGGAPAMSSYIRANAVKQLSAPRTDASSIASAPNLPALGPSGAPLVLVVFSDFQCSFCARFAVALHRAKQTFGDDLRLEFRNFPLSFHDMAPLAARAAVCAQEKGKFWELHDHLFGFQHRLSPDELPLLVSEVGLDPLAVSDCMKLPETQARVQADLRIGEQLRIEGTPSFVLNGRLYNGALLYDELEQELRAALAASRH